MVGVRPLWDDDTPAEGQVTNRATHAAPTLLALVRAQDAVARLEATLDAASADVAHGLRARTALHEAAGFLAHRRMSVHPHDLALREAGLTGSYTTALLTGRIAQALPAGNAVLPEGWRPDDWLVDRALAYARLWRRLAERATWQPLREPDAMAALLTALGERQGDGVALASWLGGLRQTAGQTALHAAADVATRGLPGMDGPDDERPGLAGSFVAACVWRHRGYGRPVSLPFWSAPLARIETLTRGGDGDGDGAYLDCVAEASLRARRDLGRLQAAERRAAGLAVTARSHLKAAAGFALRHPVVTASQLAAGIGVSGRAGLDLIGRLLAEGLLREVTGRAAWRAFTIA